ncbi:MFS transporter [Ramlibacter sp. H39-3-26]|uniref:MFS transporter n=1 Tax=Curvibacter soli TaxID=3031331 RepID=UPI0023DA771F|nr:MFS transporter [Ramlibacter sp. H39-3-26]MDF1484344.1 MFS transporter [Ramlibacter sp. H39-3-26]
MSTQQRNAVRAARLQFFCVGFVFATWGVHIPSVGTHYGMGAGPLGLAMLAVGTGALLGLSRAGRLVARHGPRRVVRGCALLAAPCLALLLHMPGFAALLVLLALFGAATSVNDVAINTEAAALEQRAGRPLMSGLHAMFSTGGMAGALLGGALLARGIAPQAQLVLLAAVGAATMLGAAARMLPPIPAPAPDAPRPRWRPPPGPLLALGLMAALGLMVEGAMYDWSVLYLRQERHSPPGQAALAYACFSAAMAAMRFAGDGLRARFAAPTLLRASAALAACALVGAMLAPTPWLALAGFALVGAGLANVVPLLFVAAARQPGQAPAQSIASVSSLGYAGLMAGPPLIGLIAHHGSLTLALLVVAGFAGVLALVAPRVGG